MHSRSIPAGWGLLPFAILALFCSDARGQIFSLPTENDRFAPEYSVFAGSRIQLRSERDFGELKASWWLLGGTTAMPLKKDILLVAVAADGAFTYAVEVPAGEKPARLALKWQGGGVPGNLLFEALPANLLSVLKEKKIYLCGEWEELSKVLKIHNVPFVVLKKGESPPEVAEGALIFSRPETKENWQPRASDTVVLASPSKGKGLRATLLPHGKGWVVSMDRRYFRDFSHDAEAQSTLITLLRQIPGFLH